MYTLLCAGAQGDRDDEGLHVRQHRYLPRRIRQTARGAEQAMGAPMPAMAMPTIAILTMNLPCTGAHGVVRAGIDA